MTTIVSLLVPFDFGEAAFGVLESDFLTDNRLGCGGSIRSVGSGDKSGGRFKGTSENEGFDECNFVSIGFVTAGPAFFGGRGDTGGF